MDESIYHWSLHVNTIFHNFPTNLLFFQHVWLFIETHVHFLCEIMSANGELKSRLVDNIGESPVYINTSFCWIVLSWIWIYLKCADFSWKPTITLSCQQCLSLHKYFIILKHSHKHLEVAPQGAEFKLIKHCLKLENWVAFMHCCIRSSDKYTRWWSAYFQNLPFM